MCEKFSAVKQSDLVFRYGETRCGQAPTLVKPTKNDTYLLEKDLCALCLSTELFWGLHEGLDFDQVQVKSGATPIVDSSRLGCAFLQNAALACPLSQEKKIQTSETTIFT